MIENLEIWKEEFKNEKISFFQRINDLNKNNLGDEIVSSFNNIIEDLKKEDKVEDNISFLNKKLKRK